MALLKQFAEALAGAVKPDLHGVGSQVHRGGDVSDRQIQEVMEDQHGAVPRI